MIEPNEFKSDNMMHSIKSMGKKDADYDEASMKKEKNMSCESKQEKKEMKKAEKKQEEKCGHKEAKKSEKMQKASTDMSHSQEHKGMYCTMMKEDMMEKKGVAIGDKMPNMTVQTTMGMKTLPDDYLGKWLILFSHPGDFTPVCTTEFVSFAKNYENFKQLDTQLLGLSVDQVQPHIKWVKWIEENLCTPIPFPIIADPLGWTANKLGMIHSARKTQTVRAVFFVDPTGTIRMILYYPAEVGRNVEEIIRALAALQIADKHKVAMPANWPNNELIGDQVIIPPPTTIEGAEKNKAENCCYDWWFCYKPLE